MIDWNTLVADKLVRPTSGQTMHDAWNTYRPAVSWSSEMRRVLGLPRRGLELDGTARAEAIIDRVMGWFARPAIPGRRCRCAEIDPGRHREEGCIERLRLPQAQALREIAICGGLFGPLSVGWGKTLIDLLAPLAFRIYDKNINDVVLMVPPGLAKQLEGDYAYYGQHFKMPQIVFHGVDYMNTCNKLDTRVPLERGAPTVHVVPYSRISRPEATSWLERELKPHAIIADECFPADTRVITDEGPLPIGEIVEQNRGRLALSYSIGTSKYVWRRITNRLRRDGTKPLVRVTHERGSFVCTEDHKIWTTTGYVRAKDLSSASLLLRARLSEVWHSVRRAESLRPAEVEVSRQAEDRDSQFSRVVSVEVLERGSSERDGESRGRDPVYDLTVEGEHNYFADGILVSNCHKLRAAGKSTNKGATGARMWRYMEEVAPQTKFVALSGSMTADKIQDYWHLIKWALRGGSPLPVVVDIVDEWGTALNPSDNPADPGRLMQLCAPGEHLYNGFKRRIAETVGVVTTAAPAVDVPLTLTERKAPPIPDQVKKYLADVRQENPTRPDGQELLTALEIAECAMQLALGFYYRWIFPDCEFPRDDELVREWREARKQFFREIRVKLKNQDEHMDSPRLVMNAAERFYGLRPRTKGLPVWEAKAFPGWNKISGLVRAETEAVCFNDYIVQDIAVWAREHRGVVWYEHNAIGEWVAKLSGLPKYGGGKKAKEDMLGDPEKGTTGEDGSRSIIASVEAHGTGTNGLQHRFRECLLLHITPNPNKVEQTLGRLHRPGQNRDVTAYFYRHTEELKKHIDDALSGANYVESTGFGQQKILKAWQE